MEINTKEHLIEHDNNNNISTEKKIAKESGKSVSYFKLQYRFAETSDVIIVVLAFISSIVVGLAMPAFSFLFGNTLNNLGPVTTPDEFMDIMSQLSLRYIYVGAVVFVFSFLMIFLWNITGKTLASRMKTEYFKAIMSQEQGWFDQVNSFEFATKVQAQTTLIENGMGDKVGNAILSLSMFFAAFFIGFMTSWKLTLVLMSLLPLLAIGGFLISKGMQEGEKRNRQSYEKAGGIAEETLYNIKTVASFGNLNFEMYRYDSNLLQSMIAGIKNGLKTALVLAFIFFVIYSAYGLAIWYGSTLIYNDVINDITGKPFGAGDVLTVLLSIVFGAFALGQTAPNFKAISIASNAASEFFELSERKPLVSSSGKNLMPSKDEIHGQLSLQNIDFSYPSKPDQTILKGLSFIFEAGKKYAIVGASGSGKSTIVSLVERLYDPDNGQILLDGYNYNDIQINYLRSLIGYVSQEPVLFNSTIRDNIVFGRENITDEDIMEACKKSYANEFIDKLEGGLDYIVGIKGSKLSGGQKQRIAIARAILIKPKFLILDEATSALDNKSEKEIQKSLDSVSSGITTIIVAHRLSTIINADVILVLDKGKIVEIGDHNTLLRIQDGHYYNLFQGQLIDEQGKEGHNIDDLRVSRGKSRKSIHNEAEKQNNDEEVVLIDKKELQKQEAEYFEKSKKKLLSLLSNNKLLIAVASIFAALNGTVFPIYGLLLSSAITALKVPEKEEMLHESLMIAIKFLIFGVSAAILSSVQHYSFNRIGETLTRKLRKIVYDKYLRLHMGFFDRATNSPGALLTKLSTDTTKINGIAITVVGVYLQTIITLCLGLGIGFYYDWRLSLITLGFIPFIIISSVLQNRLHQGFNAVNDSVERDAGSILSESVINTKTIFSYNFQERVTQIYETLIMNKKKTLIKASLFNGIFYGFSQFILYGSFSALYYFGAKFIVNGTLNYEDMNKAIFGIIFSCYGMGTIQMYVGDYAKAKEALISLYKVIDENSEIDPFDTIGKLDIPNNFQGSIEFKNVQFTYPTRSKQIIFNDLSFKIQPGTKAAFVGFSGCGKSTIVQLIERFYEPTNGQILIDGVDIKDYDLLQLRRRIGLVMQEPVLFRRNIIDNIRYGNLEASKDEIQRAVEKAQIIDLLEQNNNEHSLVSGGQKQRVAIARAILKNPSILLLDEATSALDKESEHLVQNALDRLMENRTSLIVAHR